MPRTSLAWAVVPLRNGIFLLIQWGGCGMNDWGIWVRILAEAEIYPAQRQSRQWDPPFSLSNGYSGALPAGIKRPRLRMRGSTPHTPPYFIFDNCHHPIQLTYCATQVCPFFKGFHVHVTRIQNRAATAELGLFQASRQTSSGTLWSVVLVRT